MSEKTINQVKSWLFPSAIGILGMFIWRDLSELRTDVKTLLAQSAEDKIKIQKVEQDMDRLRTDVWENRSANGKHPKQVMLTSFLFEGLKPENLTLKTQRHVQNTSN
jgi:hypothetical protein